jgi:hypothetical protein
MLAPTVAGDVTEPSFGQGNTRGIRGLARGPVRAAVIRSDANILIYDNIIDKPGRVLEHSTARLAAGISVCINL